MSRVHSLGAEGRMRDHHFQPSSRGPQMSNLVLYSLKLHPVSIRIRTRIQFRSIQNPLGWSWGGGGGGCREEGKGITILLGLNSVSLPLTVLKNYIFKTKKCHSFKQLRANGFL